MNWCCVAVTGSLLTRHLQVGNPQRSHPPPPQQTHDSLDDELNFVDVDRLVCDTLLSCPVSHMRVLQVMQHRSANGEHRELAPATPSSRPSSVHLPPVISPAPSPSTATMEALKQQIFQVQEDLVSIMTAMLQGDKHGAAYKTLELKQ